jgi:uncharacterized membrane protein
MLLWLYIALIVICWALTPFLKKRLLQKMGTYNLLVVNHLTITLLIIIYFIYLFKRKKCTLSCLKKLDKYDILILVFMAAATVISTVLLMESLTTSNISQLMPTITTLVIVLTLIISCYYGEKLDIYKIVGILFIIVGIILLNFIK